MLITVITNCFKSTATLERTYQSLLMQTVQSFEWVLVDDCSTDEGKTKELILHLAEIAPFPVYYHFLEENHYGAKSTFTACTIANGEYACILDHDDELHPSAIENVLYYIGKYKNDIDFVGVCGRCIDRKGNLIGKEFLFNQKLSKESEIRFKYQNTSEFFQFTKTDVLKEVFSKMKRGYTNGFCWLKICETHRYLYINDIFRVYDTNILTSISNTNKLNKTTIEGYLESLKYVVNSQTQFFKYNYKYSCRLLYQMLVYSHFSKGGTFSHIASIKFPFNFLLVFCYPLAWFRFKKYK